ncbi:uncharacterized protein N7479_003471 [Penicillium vulpinum]|uniref:uncharacterized protein n=1 Tax=Penicillium vulpinum TaxID=29845 RepID=UPI00254897CC|nr:uncharacterized protein N7479_003471 [Penicillium vulpinum]KAJ5963595.1 hypothetical protein N7479_003471 [Penicillium vulpinum]
MAYNLSLEEYFQISQLGSDQPNHHPGTSTIQPPASRVEQSSALSTNWPLYDPSMNYGSAYVDPNWITYTTTIGEPIAESMYQGNIQPSSTTQAKAEDHPHPHQTTIQIQSPAFASSHSTRESSAPNENNVTRNEPQERE